MRFSTKLATILFALCLPVLAHAGLSVRTDSFVKSTCAATCTQAVTGIGFTPKAIIFWGGGGATSSGSLTLTP